MTKATMVLCALVLNVTALGLPALAEAQVQPAFDVEGVWQSGPIGTAQCFRDGSNVTCVLVNAGFSHVFVGRYVSPTRIAMQVTRRTRANGCTTAMSLTITMLSSGMFLETWIALDSTCDLRAGQSATDPTWSRVL